MINVRMAVVALIAAGWACCPIAAGQVVAPPKTATVPPAPVTVPGKPPTDEAFAETIQARLVQIDSLPGTDDAVKAQLRDIYQQAQTEIETAKGWAAKITDYQSRAANAPVRIEQTKAELAALPTAPDILVPDAVTVSEIEQAIANRESELNEMRAKLAKAEGEPKLRASLRGEIPRKAARARDRLATVNAELQALLGGDDSAPERVARRALAWSQRRSLEQELVCYDRQLAMYEATSDLSPLERDLAARRTALGEQEIKLLLEIVNQRRQQEAEKQLAKASVEAAVAQPAIRRLAEANAQIAERRKTLAERITAATKGLEQANRELAAVKENYRRSREKVDAVGLSNAIGMLLRKQRESLPHVSHRNRDIAARQLEIHDVQLVLMQLGEDRAELADCEPKVNEVIGEMGEAAAGSERADLERQVREALRLKKEYLDALIVDHNTYFDKLVDLDNAERQLIEKTEEYAQYIDERVLWIASDPLLETSDLRFAGDALWWLVSPDSCAELGRTLAADTRSNPALPLPAIFVFTALVVLRPKMRDRLELIGERAAKANCCRFLPTLEAVLLTALLAAVYPGMAAYIGWRLCWAIDATEACKAVGAGLLVAARVFCVLDFLRIACRSRGLASAHFDWPQSAVAVLRRNVAWLRIAIVPAVFFTVAMAIQPNDRWDGALGRVAFLAALTMCLIFLHRALNPWRGAFQEMLALRGGDWLSRLRYLWYMAALATPVALGVVAAAGYYYTAEQLAQRMALSVYLLIALVLMRSLLLRWIRVNRRKLAIDQARKRRAAQLEAGMEDGGSEVTLPQQPDRDLDAINTQTRRFVEYSVLAVSLLAVWLVWADVTPALGALNRIDLWQVTEEAVSNGKTVQRVVGMVTLGGAVLALLVFFGAFMASKNLPGLLEMAVLQHLPLDAGARYAVVTVSRYTILLIGIFASCAIVGLGWAKVQWLLAAISVGLGFGLQEIFANFVSGLIILFERPIRVGDVITVDGTTGVVSKIRMRATTIVDGDRKELIVPNKAFITGQVLNWTLSDQVNRVTINVGIAYGADTQRASEMLLKAAKDHPLVLDEPTPRVTLEGFGDSALNFVLRCFLPNMENRLQVIHELHMAIERDFREAGIEIPFPQTDLHIRTLDIAPEAIHPTISRVA